MSLVRVVGAAGKAGLVSWVSSPGSVLVGGCPCTSVSYISTLSLIV